MHGIDGARRAMLEHSASVCGVSTVRSPPYRCVMRFVKNRELAGHPKNPTTGGPPARPSGKPTGLDANECARLSAREANLGRRLSLYRAQRLEQEAAGYCF